MARFIWISLIVCNFALVEACEFSFGPPESELTSEIDKLRTLGQQIITAAPATAATLIEVFDRTRADLMAERGLSEAQLQELLDKDRSTEAPSAPSQAALSDADKQLMIAAATVLHSTHLSAVQMLDDALRNNLPDSVLGILLCHALPVEFGALQILGLIPTSISVVIPDHELERLANIALRKTMHSGESQWLQPFIECRRRLANHSAETR
jgi:hypothetical protein